MKTLRPGNAAALLLLQLAFVSGCLNHPRNNQLQASKGAVVSFDGFLSAPSQVVSIYIQNNVSGAFEPIAHAPIVSAAASASGVVKDKSGATWYPFTAGDVVLPTGSQYWVADPAGSMVNVAHVKATAPEPPSGPLDLFTFDVTADNCIQSAGAASGGGAIIQQCASRQSPVVTINATCGGDRGDCCLGARACVNDWQQCMGYTCQTPVDMALAPTN